MTLHSAVLPTQQHTAIAFNALQGNPNFAMAVVMLHDVPFADASKVASAIAAHGLPPLDWQPPITQPTQSTPPVPTPSPETPAPVPEPASMPPSAEPPAS